ncbi:MAG: ADP-ribosylglycohydrolase family protein [Gemmatimonas sp.]
MTQQSTRDRAIGALLGLAVGDALGTTLEFTSPANLTPLTDMIGGGPFSLEPGQWTDDTSMALCLGESLLERRTFDANDQMSRYLRWFRHGHWSSTGRCFDIGNIVRHSLEAFERGDAPPWGPTHEQSAGNGSLMRLAPVPIYWHREPALAISRAADSSRTTHGTATAVDACRFASGLIVGAMTGATKEELLAPRYTPVPGAWNDAPLHPLIDAVASGSYARKTPPEIRGDGYVVRSLEAALWAFATTTDFRTGALAAVNLGEDADTTGAVYGQLAGAYYGVEGIPQEWRERVTRAGDIVEMAERLVSGAAGET